MLVLWHMPYIKDAETDLIEYSQHISVYVNKYTYAWQGYPEWTGVDPGILKGRGPQINSTYICWNLKGVWVLPALNCYETTPPLGWEGRNISNQKQFFYKYIYITFYYIWMTIYHNTMINTCSVNYSPVLWSYWNWKFIKNISHLLTFKTKMSVLSDYWGSTYMIDTYIA